ncbi:hypothetical protein KCT17_003658 [Escherichia coli]|nr:hypothetical protein [Escherichia coli]
MAADIHARYYQIKLALRRLFDERLTGREQAMNSHQWWFLCHEAGDNPTLYACNAGRFVYDMTTAQLADLLDDVQKILDDHLAEGGSENIWALEYVAAQVKRGTLEASTNLAHQSPVYAAMTTLGDRLSSPAIQNQIAHARLVTFNDWTGISDAARADLSNVITSAVARGVNPRETAKVISQRLDVSESKAANIAQTEQLGALRSAQRSETDWARDTLGINAGLLWLSALKPVTRPWHASRHGRVYTSEEIEAFYAEGGNRWRCYCSQIPCLLNPDGTLANPGLAEKMAAERERWTGNRGKARSEPERPKITPPAQPQPAPKPQPKPTPAPKPEPVVERYSAPEFQRQPTIGKLTKYATGRVAETVKLPAGADVEQMNNAVALMQEIQDRFSIPQARYLGGAKGDTGHRYGTSKNMLAAYAPSTRAVLTTKNAFDAERLAASAEASRRRGFISGSRAFAALSENEPLTDIIYSMDHLPWMTVPTPRGIFAHEYGHVVHAYNNELIDPIARKAEADGWGHALSKYGQTNHSEYVAEAFALYIENPTEAKRRVYPALIEAFEKLDKATK